MRDHASTSDEEIREHLRFGPRWFVLGIVDEEILALTIGNFRAFDDDCDEHWRVRGFQVLPQPAPPLNVRTVRRVIRAGAEDPHWTMGQSIMLDVLKRAECPACLRHAPPLIQRQ